MAFGRGVGGLAKAAALSGGLVGFLAAVSLGPTRALLQRHVLPKPGQGPTPQQREAGFFDLRLLARGTTDAGTVVLRGRVAGDRDPGYGDTARMLGESAVCLALDPLGSGGGVITPRVAMGEALLGRLRAAGLMFAVDD